MTDEKRAIAIKAAIELISEKRVTPQILVDATQPGVVVLEWVKAQYGKQLVIDLDLTYPLNLVMGEEGVKADLAFGGFVTRCTFPWDAIIAVRGRDPMPAPKAAPKAPPRLGGPSGARARPKLVGIRGGKK